MPNEESAVARSVDRAHKRRLKEALDAEQAAQYQERQHLEWQRTGAYLTWEQALVGEGCRGCGLSLIDPDRRGEPRSRDEFDSACRVFEAAHETCTAGRWSMEGEVSLHCVTCCPLPPVSPQREDRVRRILRSARGLDLSLLDTWRIDLTCGHSFEHEFHHASELIPVATISCTVCGVTRGVVSSERKTDSAKQAAEDGRRIRLMLNAQREVARATARLEASIAKLAALEQSVDRPSS